MNVKTCFSLLLIAISVGSWSVAQNVSDTRLYIFKERIGYVPKRDQSASVNADTLVICGIPDLSTCPILESGFHVEDDSIYTISHGVGIEKLIRYRKNKTIIDVDFYYFPNDFLHAENIFFGIPSSANTGGIPGTRGPLNLGDISVELPNPYGTQLLFLKDNICVGINSHDSSYNVLPLAGWIQSQFQMRPWGDVQSRLPRPTRETIGKRNVREGQALINAQPKIIQSKVGESIEVDIEMSPGVDKSQYPIRLEFDHQQFRSTKINDVITIIPTKLGQGQFRYVVIDKKTLLFSTYDVPVDVQP